ncbi:MAG: FxsA family protein [Gammaproteobacteria bacterium]|jgi:UPF0716 protein FxsA
MPFLLIFLVIFVFIPLTELYVIIEVGDKIGAFATIWLVVLTAVLGGWLVRKQGMGILFRIRQQMERGEAPAIEMLEGALLAIMGILLLLPGFITDALGFLLLIPPLRKFLVVEFLKRSGAMTSADVTIVRQDASGRRRIDVIEGEFSREQRGDQHHRSD